MASCSACNASNLYRNIKLEDSGASFVMEVLRCETVESVLRLLNSSLRVVWPDNDAWTMERWGCWDLLVTVMEWRRVRLDCFRGGLMGWGTSGLLSMRKLDGSPETWESGGTLPSVSVLGSRTEQEPSR